MGLGIRDIIGRSLYRTFQPNGLLLIAAMAIAYLVFQVGLSSLLLPVIEDLVDQLVAEYPEVFESAGEPTTDLPLAFELPAALAMGLSVVGSVLTVVVLGVAVRVFATETTESIPRELVTENFVWMAINLLIGTVVFTVGWAIGLSLFLVPGIVIFVLLIYYLPAIVVENRSFIDGMARSWSLTAGQRVDVFLLFLAVFLLTFAASFAVLLVNGFFILIHPLIGEVVNLIANAIMSIFFAAVVALSFNDLAPDRPPSTDDEDPFDEFIPADRNVQW